MQCRNTATRLKGGDRNSNTFKEREKERQRERGCLHAMPSFLPSCLWGSQRVVLSTREQLVREWGGEGGIWTSTASDHMPYYEANSSFFVSVWAVWWSCVHRHCCRAWIMYVRLCLSCAEGQVGLVSFYSFVTNHRLCSRFMQICTALPLKNGNFHFLQVHISVIEKEMCAKIKWKCSYIVIFHKNRLSARPGFTFQANSLTLYKKCTTVWAAN